MTSQTSRSAAAVNRRADPSNTRPGLTAASTGRQSRLGEEPRAWRRLTLPVVGCLVIVWRYRDDSWEGYVAVTRDGSVLITWQQASRLHPVVDDGWQLPPRGT